MLSYAGVYLGAPTAEVAAWVATNVSVEDCFTFAPRYGPGAGFGSDPPYRPEPPPGPVRVGRFFYPWGASRFATAHYVVDTPSLQEIRAYCYPDAGTIRAAPLVLDDGAGASVTTDLWMLPPRPLSRIADDPGLWLLTLVDERWYWWWRAATVAAAATWADLYTAIGTAIGVTIEAEAVDAAYLTPPASLTAYYPALPILLDAVAASVGQRVVRTFAGKIKTQSAAKARESWELQRDTFAERKIAGGGLEV